MRDPKRIVPLGVGLLVVVIVIGVALSGAFGAKPVASTAPAAELPSPPPATSWPGFPWTFRGSAVDRTVITLAPAPTSCKLDGVLVLTMGKRLGEAPATPADARQFVRDTGHAVSTVGRLEASPSGPSDGFFTGYQYGTIELWLSASAGSDYVFLKRGNVWEKWPRVSTPLTCT
jgi:hypothetical protein